MTENRRIFMVFTKLCPLEKSGFFCVPEISLCQVYCFIFAVFSVSFSDSFSLVIIEGEVS